MIATMTLDELTIRAEVIAYASVKTTEDAGESEPGMKLMKTHLQITNVLKGAVKVGDIVEITTVKGMEDEPEFLPKGNYLLLLKKNAAGEYQTVNLIQGAWPVDNNGMFAGLGLGTTPDQLKKSIAATKDKMPPADDDAAPEPEF
ncbi:MAG TPA: hypothetical protein PKO06_09925 [Candidatus Ozemobacteraceae bacterium]|nr:hypothetical protein [Candidatus Ozemobacteraceae bacterium]